MPPFEVIVILHLKTGASIKYLALGEGNPFPDQETFEHTSKKNEPKTIFDIDVFTLNNGKLSARNTLAFDKVYLDQLGVLNVMAVENNGTTYIEDKEVRQAVSGTYLVDMDGPVSLNKIQRLPSKKLAISFNGSIIRADELDVKVVGRVASVLERV